LRCGKCSIANGLRASPPRRHELQAALESGKEALLTGHTFKTDKTTADKMMNEKTRNIGALAGLMLKRESNGAFAFQGGSKRDQVSDSQGDKSKTSKGFAQRQQAHQT
jgi:hypothetical protein